MKNYNEMANDVLQRIKVNNEIKAKKRKLYVKYVTSFAAMIVIAIVGINVWQNAKLTNNAEPPTVDNKVDGGLGATNESTNNPQMNMESNTEIENAVIPEDEEIIWADSNDNMEMAIVDWNGKKISISLYEAFNNNEGNRVYAIAANCNHVDKDYMYNGKNIAEYETEMLKKQKLIDKLGDLYKEGDYLKYGKDLYLIGTPEGEKWSKEVYDERVSMYGEDVLNTYIQNGEFLKDKLENDLQNLLKEELQSEYENALGQYIDYVNKNMKEELEEKNIASDFSSDVDYLVIYATESEFEKLQMENQSDWMFYLAPTTNDEPQDMDDVEVY